MTGRLALAAVVVGLIAGSAGGSDQTILGKSIEVRSRPGDATRRQVKGSAKEKDSPNTLIGDPTLPGGMGGAALTIVANGATPSAQAFVLYQGTSTTGEPFWSGDAATGFTYRDPNGEHGAVERASIRRSASGSFVLKISLSGKNGPLAIVPPNPGSDACVALQIGLDGSGDRYSVQFGPESKIRNDGDLLFKAKHPLVEGVCPTIVITTTTSSPSTTMIDRCCVAGACLRINPPGCFSAGGIPIGDGDCEPNPCAGLTTTTTTTLP